MRLVKDEFLEKPPMQWSVSMTVVEDVAWAYTSGCSGKKLVFLEASVLTKTNHEVHP
jgi:hypothetical protein